MSDFDKELAVRELEGYLVLIDHSLRRLKIARDDAGSKEFYLRLARVTGRARNQWERIGREKLVAKRKT